MKRKFQVQVEINHKTCVKFVSSKKLWSESLPWTLDKLKKRLVKYINKVYSYQQCQLIAISAPSDNHIAKVFDIVSCLKHLFSVKTGNFPLQTPSTSTGILIYSNAILIVRWRMPLTSDRLQAFRLGREIHHNFHSSFDVLFSVPFCPVFPACLWMKL